MSYLADLFDVSARMVRTEEANVLVRLHWSVGTPIAQEHCALALLLAAGDAADPRTPKGRPCASEPVFVDCATMPKMGASPATAGGDTRRSPRRKRPPCSTARDLSATMTIDPPASSRAKRSKKSGDAI